MPPAPPILTPERIDAMLSHLAEACIEAIDEALAQLKQASDAQDHERYNRCLGSASRNLRQTMAMKQRHDREQARLAADARREAEDERQAAKKAHDAIVERRCGRVRKDLYRTLWNEY